jgi:ATP-dependent DNA helicase RecG
MQYKYLDFREDIKTEFKSDEKCLGDEDIIEAVVAFANTKGGCLYLGVEDDGKITGLHEKHKDITQLSAFIANRTIPTISVRAEIVEDTKNYIKIEVPESKAIIATSSGKTLRRRIKTDGTPENIPMYPYEMSSRLSDLSLLDYSSQPVPECEYSDLDGVERQRLRNIINSYNGEKQLLELDDEELDKALQLVKEINGKLIPTFAGLILIGKESSIKRLMPTVKAAFQVTQNTEVRVNETFSLPLIASLEKMFSYMEVWNPEKEFEVGLFRIPLPEFDKRAFREAIVNAFCHRDYTMLGRVRIMIDDEGLTVSNPGGFIEGIEIDNLLTAEPHGRNPVLADALKRIGLAERTGRGIDRIFEGSLLYGKTLPDYSGSNSRQVSLFIARSTPNKAFIKMIAEEQNKTGQIMSVNKLLVLYTIAKFSRVGLDMIATDSKLNIGRVKSIVEKLVENGLVEAVGSNKNREYILSGKVYKETNNSIKYVRQTDIDKVRYPEMVLKLASEKGKITRSDVAKLLQLTPPQAYRIIQKLIKDDKLELVGSGRNSGYKIKQ